jgi:hypothetical protein
MATIIQSRNDTAANWNNINPILAQGEIGIENDTNKQKVGDGVTVWNSLVYQIGTIVPDGATFNDTTYTDAEIKTKYENNADTNAFTDAEKTLLSNQSGINTGDQDLSGYATLAGENTFTGVQTTNIVASGNTLDASLGNNFNVTATATDITMSNQAVGQGGTIVIDTYETITGWSTDFSFPNGTLPSGVTGTQTLAYFVLATNDIKIGLVNA